jgi:hypothetical protein
MRAATTRSNNDDANANTNTNTSSRWAGAANTPMSS